VSVTQDAAEACAAPTRADTGRLLWRCRRGMKELDVLLERFARKRFMVEGEAAERHTFARFLELPDPLLADYLLRSRVPPEPEFAALARSILGVSP